MMTFYEVIASVRDHRDIPNFKTKQLTLEEGDKLTIGTNVMSKMDMITFLDGYKLDVRSSEKDMGLLVTTYHGPSYNEQDGPEYTITVSGLPA